MLLRIDLHRKYPRHAMLTWSELIILCLVMIFIVVLVGLAFVELILHGRISN